MSSSQPTTAHVDALLAAYHAGALTPAEAAQVERHLRECPACQQQSEQIALYQVIRAAPAPTVGPELRDGLYARIAAVSSPAAQRERRRTLYRTRRDLASAVGHSGGGRGAPGWLSGAAAVVVVALLVSVFWALPYVSGRTSRGGASSVVSSPIVTVPAACPASVTSATIPKDAYLADMALTSPTEGWAVGAIVNNQDYSSQGIILRLHQCHWALARSLPQVSLTNISMDSPTDGWAFGSNSDTYTLVLMHYSNGVWSESSTSDALPSGVVFVEGAFSQVKAVAPDDVWLTAFSPKTNDGQMGPMLLFHLVNGRWTQVACPLPMLYNVAPVAPDDLWLVGGTSTDVESADTYRFARYHDGKWSVMRQPAGAELRTLHAVSPTDIWASGSIPNARSGDATTSLPVVAHYDGASWQVAPQAIPPGAGDGVMSYALGNGAGWAERVSLIVQTTPNPAAPPEVISNVWSESGGQWQELPWPYKDLTSLQAWSPVSSDEVWAIATYDVIILTPEGSGGYSGVGYPRSVLLHYADGAWSRYG